MKQLILLFAILFSSFCFAQNTGSILGIVLDGELNNEPLIFANVSVEGTTLESSSDMDGLFHFEDLAEGNYTLVFNFIGYDTKEVKVHVVSSQQADISVPLVASTLSLNNLASLNTMAKQEDKASVVINN